MEENRETDTLPVYDLYCEKCGNEKKDVFFRRRNEAIICCGEEMKHRPCCGVILGFPVEGLTLKNVELNPVHFKTRSELVKYKNKNNLELGALPND